VDDDAGLGPELASVLTAARRRAVRDGDRQIDTAHLLHSLLDYDPEVRALLDGPQLARLLGYLVQRSIGYGLRWQSGVEDSGAVPVVPGAAEGWSPVAAAALSYACGRAAGRGADRACGTDLLAGIIADPGARAVEVLGRAGVDVARLRARIDEPSVDDWPLDGEPIDDRRPLEGRPFDDRSIEGRSIEGRPFGDRPIEGRPIEGRSIEGRPFGDRPIEGRSFDDRPVDDRPVGDRLVEGPRIDGRVLDVPLIEGASQECAAGGEPGL
jgi:hypothetical protein